MNKIKLSAVIFFAFIFSAKASDYTNNDLSSPISDSANYDNVTITNDRDLSGSDSYIYFGGTISNSLNFTNNGSIDIAASGGQGALYIPNAGVESGTTPTITVNNNGTLSTTNSGISIYILGEMDDGGTMFDFSDDRRYPVNFVLNNTGTMHSESVFYQPIYIINSSEGSSEITNSGTISSNNVGISLSGSDAVINNSGTIQAGDDSENAIYVGEGNLTLNILSGSIITGKINSTGDNNILNIQTDISSANFNTLVEQLVGTWTKNMSSGATLTVASGETVASASLGGSGAIANSGTISALSVSGVSNTLTLASGSSTGDISNTGALAISTSSNITYSNAISGTGTITKTGSGRLELSGTNTYSGATTVSAGELKVNGSAASSAVTVSSGATISGTGTVGALTIQSGGTLAAGNSVGTLNVSGDLILSSGSTTNFEFDRSAIDKIIASGNISISGTANFQLLDTDGYFTVTQNILETTGGTISGTFDTTSTDNGFSTSLEYGSTAVSATISKTLNSNALDGVLSSQNSVGRLIGKSLTDQMRNAQYVDNKKITAWVSSGGFNSYSANNNSSAAYSTNGYISSAGLIRNDGDSQIVFGLFNSQANVNRFIYSGKDDVDSNGMAIAFGKNFQNRLGKLRAFTQAGVGFYNFDTRRNVNVNGAYQVGRGSGRGGFQYVGIGVDQVIPTNLIGEFGVFTSATLQKTRHNGWHEAGLSAGNLDISRSSANTLNLELGTFYKNDLPKLFHLPKNSFYKFELSGYQSELYSKKDATVTQGTTNYSLSPTYNQEFTIGTSVLFLTPISENSTITARFDKRQNGTFREFIATLGYLYGF